MTKQAYHLSDAPPRIAIECRVCRRRGEYGRDRAIARHGDVTLPNFLWLITSAECARRHAEGAGLDSCKAVFGPESRVSK